MALAQASQMRTFQGMRATTSVRPTQALKAMAPRTPRSRRSVVTQAGYLGSPTNWIFVLSTASFLAAGRAGLAPTWQRHTTAGLKLYEDKSAGLVSNDPAGFGAVDVLALGALSHVFATGLVLGLRATGNL